MSTALKDKYSATPQLHDAWEEAGRVGHHHIGTEHILYGLLIDHDVASVLLGLGIDVTVLEYALAEYIQTDPNHPGTTEEGLTDKAALAWQLADIERQTHEREGITPLDMLIGLLEAGKGLAFFALARLMYDDAAVKNKEQHSQLRNDILEKLRGSAAKYN